MPGIVSTLFISVAFVVKKSSNKFILSYLSNHQRACLTFDLSVNVLTGLQTHFFSEVRSIDAEFHIEHTLNETT